MGFKTTLTIKHATAGYSFNVEVDRDADVLGLKVLIFEAQMIPVHVQHLIFDGKELRDAISLSSAGINDADIIFMVETQKQQEKEAAVPPPPPTKQQQEVQEISIPSVIIQQAIPIQYELEEPLFEAPVLVQNEYNLSNEVNEDKMNGVLRLSAWLRAYFWIGFVLSGLGTIFCCIWNVLIFICFVSGLMGARKLNRCLLIFPFLLTASLGYAVFAAFIVLGILSIINDTFYGHPLMMIFPFLASIVNIVFNILLFKFGRRIGTLNKTEYKQCRARIRSRCCC